MERLVVLAGGGHGRVVADAALAQGPWCEIAFVEDRVIPEGHIDGWPVLGTFADVDALNASEYAFIVALGNNGMRLAWTQRLRSSARRLVTVRHPSATVSPRAQIGLGTVLCAGAIVGTGARIGLAVIVNTAATVDHDCVIGDGVHLSPGAHLGGGVEIGEGAWIGIGASVRHGIRIGAGAIVGAGAAVVADVPAGVTVMGVPARPR